MLKKIYILLSLGILSIFILSACEIQKDIVEPIEETPIDISTPIQLSEKEQCEQQGKLWFQFECINKTNQITTCEQGGGQWKLFMNGCVDSCGIKPRLCTQALQAGCDCGATQCYGQEPTVLEVIRLKCMDDPYEPYATPQEACENTGGKWEITESKTCSTDEQCQSNPTMDGCFKFVGDLGTMIGCNKIQRALEPINCPQAIPPLCEGGKLISQGFREDGCSNPLKCIKPICQCPENEIFYTDGCSIPRLDIMSIIAYK